MTIAIEVAILVLAVAGAFTIIGYEDHARGQGWPVGAWLSGSATPLKIAAMLVIPLALWKAWYLWPWWSALLVAIAGVALSFIASVTLRSRVQLPAVLAMIIGGVGALLLGAKVVQL